MKAIKKDGEKREVDEVNGKGDDGMKECMLKVDEVNEGMEKVNIKGTSVKKLLLNSVMIVFDLILLFCSKSLSSSANERCTK